MHDRTIDCKVHSRIPSATILMNSSLCCRDISLRPFAAEMSAAAAK